MYSKSCISMVSRKSSLTFQTEHQFTSLLMLHIHTEKALYEVFNNTKCQIVLLNSNVGYLSHGEKSMRDTPWWLNLWICLNFSPPHNAMPRWWKVARYVPLGDQRTYVSVQRCIKTHRCYIWYGPISPAFQSVINYSRLSLQLWLGPWHHYWKWLSSLQLRRSHCTGHDSLGPQSNGAYFPERTDIQC